MARIAAFTYGVACYAVFLATFLYSIGFIGDFGVPKSLSTGPATPLGTALLIDALLLGLFALQHSGMARPAFKRLWTRAVPEPVERSTYVLASSLALAVLYWLWRPLGGGVVWDVESPALRALLHGGFAFGWLTVLVSTFLINHFDLFGLRQVWLHLRGKPYTQLPFRTPGPYELVRHPLYVGWICVMWFAPTMSVAHLVFSLACTAYILVAIQFEERDLVRSLPGYGAYRERVPMLIPGRQEPAMRARPQQGT